jgi:hypothetical protein
MEPPSRPRITDSPWFWVLVFSLMAMAALVAIGGKYGRRQAALERQFQARERIAFAETADNDAVDFEGRTYATPDDTLVPLWPLAIIMIAVATLAALMLVRGRGRPGSLIADGSRPGALSDESSER